MSSPSTGSNTSPTSSTEHGDAMQQRDCEIVARQIPSSRSDACRGYTMERDYASPRMNEGQV